MASIEKIKRNKVYTTLGASNHSLDDRANYDYYATDPEALTKFLKAIEKDNITINQNIWECATGENHLKNRLVEHGYNVVGTDIINRNNSVDDIMDFLVIEENPYPNHDILTNPPYKYSLEFLKKGLDLIETGEKIIMILKIQFLEGKKRYEFFKKQKPRYVYIHSRRVHCAKNGNFEDKKQNNSAVCYAWFIFEKGFKGDTIIRWIG